MIVLNYVTDDEKVVKIKDLLLCTFPLRDPCNNETSLCLCRIITIPSTEKENAM